MRFTEDQIKQSILHPVKEARDAAVYYFANSYSTDPEIMLLAIQAIDKYGWDHAFDFYTFMGRMVQSEASLRWTIEQLEKCGMPDNEKESQRISWLCDVLENADLDLLATHKQEILDLDTVDEDLWEIIEERILLATFSPENIWQEFEEFCDLNKDVEYLDDEDIYYAHRIVEAMGRHPGIFDDKVLDILSQDIDDYTNNPMMWMEPCAVRLAGELRLQAAVPLIIRRLHEDGEILYPDCIRSLIKIGNDEVVDALADEYTKANGGFRISAVEIFEYIHSERSIEQSLALLDDEKDLSTKCFLCQAALMNFEDEAIGPARRLVLENELDPDVLEVRRDLLNACILMKLDFPEFEQWKEEAKHDAEFRKKWYADNYSGEVDYEEEEYPDDYCDGPLLPPETIVREQQRVGRNEPCPCGSGKKYKKCCLRKENGASTSTQK